MYNRSNSIQKWQTDRTESCTSDISWLLRSSSCSRPVSRFSPFAVTSLAVIRRSYMASYIATITHLIYILCESFKIFTVQYQRRSEVSIYNRPAYKLTQCLRAFINSFRVPRSSSIRMPVSPSSSGTKVTNHWQFDPDGLLVAAATYVDASRIAVIQSASNLENR